jgi:hypothetical protein
LRDVIVPETQLSHTATAQPSAASLIPNLLLAFSVLAAIKFN